MTSYDQYQIDGINPMPVVNPAYPPLAIPCVGGCAEIVESADGYCSECWMEAMARQTPRSAVPA